MSFTRVSSSDDRALAIRDHLLTIVRERGRLQVQRGPMQLSVFEEGGWVVDHWTPFSALSPEEASSPAIGMHWSDSIRGRICSTASMSGMARRYSESSGRTKAASM
jgi:hypothetical protein